MKAVADTLTVARSNLIERAARPTQPRRAYRKAGDEPLLVLIRRLVDERPTYGYRRITRLVNRQQKAEGKLTINAKRVLRIMQVNKLTLQRHTGRRPGRTHDGVVIALRSNIRWCSDHFELACRNGELLRVLFAIDACDREVIAWSATTAGINQAACTVKRGAHQQARSLSSVRRSKWPFRHGRSAIKRLRPSALACAACSLKVRIMRSRLKLPRGRQ